MSDNHARIGFRTIRQLIVEREALDEPPPRHSSKRRRAPRTDEQLARSAYRARVRPSAPEGTLTTAQIAERLGLCSRTVHRLRRDGLLAPPVSRLRDGTCCYRISDVDACKAALKGGEADG